MSELPVMWFGLLTLVAIFGVATWFLDNFTQRNELKKIIYLPTRIGAKIMESEIESLLAYDTKYKITDDGYRISEPV